MSSYDTCHDPPRRWSPSGSRFLRWWVRRRASRSSSRLKSRTLFRRLCLVTGNRHEAEEIMQDAFLKVFERWPRVRDMDDPTGYLYRTAFNISKKRSRRAALATLRRVLGFAKDADEFAASDARSMVADALATLTPRQRAAIVLTDLLGYSSESAGEVLGVRAVTIRVLASQGRAAMKRALEPRRLTHPSPGPGTRRPDPLRPRAGCSRPALRSPEAEESQPTRRSRSRGARRPGRGRVGSHLAARRPRPHPQPGSSSAPAPTPAVSIKEIAGTYTVTLSNARPGCFRQRNGRHLHHAPASQWRSRPVRAGGILAGGTIALGDQLSPLGQPSSRSTRSSTSRVRAPSVPICGSSRMAGLSSRPCTRFARCAEPSSLPNLGSPRALGSSP